jgi:O-antigen/teichoic acid export membrane protein
MRQVTGPTIEEPTTLVVEAADSERPLGTSTVSTAIAETKPMVWLTGVEGIARLLSFGFYLIAARVLAPQGFGVVQYTITVSLLAFGALQVLVTAIIRELGVDRDDHARTREVLGSSLAVAVALWVITSLLCLAVQAAGLASGANTLGLLAVLAGTAAFQIYYSIGRGMGDPGRQAASYAGASLAQLLMFGVLALLTQPTPTQALLIFGGSSFVPVLLYEWKRPVLRGRPLPVRRHVVRRLWLIGAPLLVAQVCYLLWNSLDQLWVQGALGSYHVGLYASAKNISLALIVIPGGVTGVLLPRISQLLTAGEVDAARRLVWLGTLGAAAASALIAVAIILLRVPLLGELYGHPYRAAAGALAALSCGMVCYAAFASLTMAAVAWGRPKVYAASIGVAAAGELVGFQVFGCRNLLTAGIVYSASIAIALLFVIILLRVRPLWAPGT